MTHARWSSVYMESAKSSLPLKGLLPVACDNQKQNQRRPRMGLGQRSTSKTTLRESFATSSTFHNMWKGVGCLELFGFIQMNPKIKKLKRCGMRCPKDMQSTARSCSGWNGGMLWITWHLTPENTSRRIWGLTICYYVCLRNIGVQRSGAYCPGRLQRPSGIHEEARKPRRPSPAQTYLIWELQPEHTEKTFSATQSVFEISSYKVHNLVTLV